MLSKENPLDVTNEGTGFPDVDEEKDKEKNEEIASAGRTLFFAALTIILGSTLMAYIAYVFQLTY